MEDRLEILVQKASSGDANALEALVVNVKDYVYNVSLKMLLYPQDAEDATQEILIRVITHLSTFKHESRFKTWVYRLATNYLITYKSKNAKGIEMSFDEYAELIDTGHSDSVNYTKNEGELSLLEEEVKVSCTQGILLCLNAEDRMVYILSEILEFDGVEGAQIMGITHDSFRKKLSRSRSKIRNFLNQKCGLANPNNPCRCKKKVDFLIQQDIVQPNDLRFAQFSQRSIDLVEKLGDLEKSLAIYRSVPSAKAPSVILKNVKQALALD